MGIFQLCIILTGRLVFPIETVARFDDFHRTVQILLQDILHVVAASGAE